MKFFGQLNKDNRGKISVFSLILLIIIAAVISFWVLIIADHFSDGEYSGFLDGAHIDYVTGFYADLFSEISLPEISFPDINFLALFDRSDAEEGGGDDTEESEGVVSISFPDDPLVPAIPNIELPPAEIEEDRRHGTPLETSELKISQEFPEIYEQLDTLSENFGCAAVSLTVYDGDTGQYFYYEYGYADIEERIAAQPETKFYIASLSKLVTAICAMTLVDSGYISLDTDVSNYFGYDVENPNFPDTAITARMLMQHTSSIFDSGAFQTSRDLGSSESVRYLIERGSSFRRNRPGSTYEYSNFGYAVLGSLCERVSGKTLDDLAREVLFDPLGIDAAYVPSKLNDTENIAVIYDSSHAVSRSVETQLSVEESDTLGHDLHLAGSNLTISSKDYAKILAMLGGDGFYQDVRILSDSAVSEIHKTNVEAPGFEQGLAVRYSVGDFIEDEGFYWHTGSSYGIYSQFSYSRAPSRGVVVVTSGASVNRLDNNMIDACTELALAAWQVFDVEDEQLDEEQENEDGSLG